MNWKSWLFPSSPSPGAERAFHDARIGAERRVRAVIQPLSEIEIGIVSASWHCTQEVGQHLRVNPKFMNAPHTPDEQRIYNLDKADVDVETRVLAELIEACAPAKLAPVPDHPIDKTLVAYFGDLKDLMKLVPEASSAIEVFERDGSSLSQMIQEYRSEISRQAAEIVGGIASAS